jgi:glutamate-ammonia-ligase adenylyltransferase
MNSGRLARMGFVDPARATTLLGLPVLTAVAADEQLVEALAATADPDAALLGLSRVLEVLVEGASPAASPKADTELVQALQADPTLRERLLAVLGASLALTDHLVRYPADWREVVSHADARPEPAAVRRDLLTAVGADPEAAQPVADGPTLEGLPDDPGDALRVAYRRRLLHLASLDLTGVLDLVEVSAQLADLAAATLDAALAIARAEVAEDAAPCRLAVIAMGKTGGQELNYVSDVDVIFVAEPFGAGGEHGDVDEAAERAALRTATRLATRLLRVCGAQTAEGTIWPVDAALRPEGKDGPLVRTLASHRAYYERWARTWEFQALLKARPVAGDAELGRAYVEALAPLVWQAAERPGFVADVQQMRRRVEEHIPAAQAERQLKLGPGGLRDVEFAVQLLQMVHGRADRHVRSPNTLEALEALSSHGYVGRSDAAELDRAYRFLRTLEHRMQLHRLRRTHVVPDGADDLRRLARSMGMRRDAVAELDRTWHQHAREVRRLHEKLFYRPLLNAVARLAPDEVKLTTDAARSRLEALGYENPAGALRHLEALTSGVSRRAAIQRALLPAMLGWFADSPDPDAGLFAFRQVSEALGTTPWYLRVLRDEGETAQRMARVLSTSRYVSELLLGAPEGVAILGDDAQLQPRSARSLVSEAVSAVRRHADPRDGAAAARALRRRELVRIAMADLLGMLDVEAVGEALTQVAVGTLSAGLEAATRAVEQERGEPLPTRLAVIGMGRFGGHELGYSSDADVLFVHDPLPGTDEREAASAAHAVANEVRRLLALPAADPPLEVDADLRPEGRQGPLVRTLASYAAYYARWSATWESQALLRAEPVAGDAELGARFVELIDPLRYPAAGLSDADLREIRRIKARVESERLPRGANRSTHLKLGPGGLSDVEWTVQTLQLGHAHQVPSLRTTRTMPALRAAVEAGLIEDEDGDVLERAWLRAARLRDAVMLVRGRPADNLPVNARELAAVGCIVGFAPDNANALLDDYRRTARRARAVVERLFYG